MLALYVYSVIIVSFFYTLNSNYLPKTVCVLATPGFLSPLWAAEFTVNDLNDAVDADLDDPVYKTASGTCTLRATVQQANKLHGTDSIVVPEGTCELTLGKELAVTSNLHIQGSGPGKVVISGKKLSRVFGIKYGAFAAISGITVTQGKAYDGGGIKVWGSSKLSLINSVISDNASDNNGAGLYISVSTVALDNTTVSGNRSGGFGGAIYIEGNRSTLAVHESTLEQNSSVSGGGLYCDTAENVYLEKTGLNSNSSGGSNTVAGGGAIYNRMCSVSLNQTTFDRNRAEKRGGALFNAGKGGFSIINSTFSNNSATAEDGSALYDAGSSSLAMVTISGNSARSDDGGALYHNSNSDLVVKNSTVAHNAGGNLNNALGNLQMKNSLVANAVTGVDCMGAITSDGYNRDSDGTCALSGEGDATSANLLLLALQDNGGSMLTHELGAGSPVINAGLPDDCPPLDQRFCYRADRCDIGAYEAGSVPAQTGSIAFKRSVDMVRESAGIATITLTRSMGSDGPVSIHYQDDPFSIARSNFDFIDLDGELEWADGESGDKSFQIQIVPDGEKERMEPLKLLLGNPAGGVDTGADRTAILNIVDDAMQFGELAFDSASHNVEESAGNLDIIVRRSNGDFGEISVMYATADKEATAGKDYTAVSGMLIFADMETSKTISIPIMNDSDDEPDETFILQLSNTTGGAIAGAYNSAIVTIADDDESGGADEPGDEPTSGDKTSNSGTTETSSSSSKKGGGGSLNLFLLLTMVAGLYVRCGRAGQLI